MIKLLAVLFGMVCGITSFLCDRWSVLGGAIALGAYYLMFGFATINPSTVLFMAISYVIGAVTSSLLISIAAFAANRITQKSRVESCDDTFTKYEKNPMYAGLAASHIYHNLVERSPLASAIQDGMNQTNKVHHLYGHNNIPNDLDLELSTKPDVLDSESTKVVRFVRGD